MVQSPSGDPSFDKPRATDDEFLSPSKIRERRALVKLRSRSIDSAILEHSNVIPKYMTLYGYKLQFKTSLRGFDFSPCSWVQIIMDMPDGLNKFRKSVVARSAVQLHTLLPRWSLTLYLEDVYGGHKATVEVQLWVWNNLREEIMLGSTGPTLVEDLVFAKPGKHWNLAPPTKKRKTITNEIPYISIVSSEKVPPQERSRFYSVTFSVIDVPLMIEETDSCHIYLEILGVPIRSLKSLDLPVSKYVPIAKTEMLRSLNPQWEPLVIDTQACGGRHSIIQINLCTFTEDFQRVIIGTLHASLHDLTQASHYPFVQPACKNLSCQALLHVEEVLPLGGDENDSEPNYFSFFFQALELNAEIPFFFGPW
jgi:hypothetical protein